MTRLRWSVCWAILDPTLGHEQSGRRPVLVVSQESFNRNSGLVTVVPITSTPRQVRSWEVAVPAGVAGLRADSIILGAQLRTLSRERLHLPPLGRILDAALRRQVASAILLHLGFSQLERLDVEE